MRILSFFSSQNFDLVAVCVTVAAIIILGVAIYLANRNSITNRTFLLFSLSIAVYAVFNYFSYKISDPIYTIWLLRGIIFFATLASLLLFKLFYVFPEEKSDLPALYTYLILPFSMIVAGLTLTPFIFSGIQQYPSAGQPAQAILGPGMPIFGFTSGILVVAAVFQLIAKWRRAKGEQKMQFILVFIGAAVTFAGITIFNIVFPLLLENVRYIIFAPVIFFPFIGLTSLAISRYHLFDIKIFTIAVLTFFLTVTIAVGVVFSNSLLFLLFSISQFVLVLIVSLWLLKATLKEIDQRKLIQKQEQELEVVNKQQEGLLHFISHEIKGYLTKNEAEFAAIVEGDYGTVSESLKALAASALEDTRKGVGTVMDILDASNLKKGTVAYDKKQFDFSAAVQDVVNSLKPMAEEKGISLEFASRVGATTINGDENKLRHHVIRNLIDNSIRYTPSGNVKVILERVYGSQTAVNMIRMTVQDTGVGISPEDMKKLFTEGGHGAESIKVNVHSTGYGLFIAKSIVEAHGGKIWAESEGKGKGSRFFVELPAA